MPSPKRKTVHQSESEHSDEADAETPKVHRKTALPRTGHHVIDTDKHPSYKDMVIESIREMGDEANFNDILKHITTYYTLKNNSKFVKYTLAQTISKLIDNGGLEQIGSQKVSKNHVYGTFRVNEDAVAFGSSKPLKKERTPEREMPTRAARNKPTRSEVVYSTKSNKRKSSLNAPPSDDSEVDEDYSPKKAFKV